MHRIHTVTEIPAPPAEVWAALTDTASFPDWNPFLRRLDGRLALDERLTVEITPPDGRAMTFRPRVVALEPDRRLTWLGRLGMPGLFDGRHSFELEDLGQGRTRLVHAEEFSGVLVPLLRSTLRRTEQGFQAMNAALVTEVARRRAVRTTA